MLHRDVARPFRYERPALAVHAGVMRARKNACRCALVMVLFFFALDVLPHSEIYTESGSSG